MAKSLIKIGGALLEDKTALERFCLQIKTLLESHPEEALTIVHGAGPTIGRRLKEAGFDFEFVGGVRKTTEAMLGVLEKALWQEANAKLFDALEACGLRAKRISGYHQKAMLAEIIEPQLGRVGQPVEFHLPDPIPGALLVFCPLGVNAQGEMLNVNADEAATGLACHLKVDRLIFFSDTAGLLDSEKRPIQQVDSTAYEALLADGVIQGGMQVKCRMIYKALRAGVEQVLLLDGGHEKSLMDLESNRLKGTRFVL